MSDLPIEMKNGYILIDDIKNEINSGIDMPDVEHNRFSRVIKTYEGSILKEGDIIIKPIGRTTPIKLNDKVYHCIREGFIFAKIVND